MQLDEYILTYKDAQGDIVCNPSEYYARYIKPLHKRFENGTLGRHSLVICPLHDDTDPSLGLMQHRFFKGVSLYHCFGCNASGSVIRLHQHIQKKYYNREIKEDEACKELASLFNIPLEDFDELAEEDYEERFNRNIAKLDKMQEKYTKRDFERELLEIRKNKKGVNLSLVNSACVKMIATEKQLYD